MARPRRRFGSSPLGGAKGRALDPDSAIAHTRLGWVQTWQRQYDDAEKNFDRAAALAPELAEVFSYQGVHYIRAGDPERALQLTTKALRLDPFAPQVDYHMGIEYLFLGRFEEAVAKLEIARDRTPKQSGVRLHLACAYVETDRMDDAAREIRELFEFSPDYTVALANQNFPFRIDAVRERFIENLRNAGLRET